MKKKKRKNDDKFTKTENEFDKVALICTGEIFYRYRTPFLCTVSSTETFTEYSYKNNHLMISCRPSITNKGRRR